MRRTLPALIALLAPLSAQAAVPALMPVTGFLTDSSGVPLDGTYDLGVKLYETPTAGTATWSDTLPVDVTQGQFTAYLGENTALNLDLFRESSSLYIALSVEGGAEMSPRIEIGAAPYAAYAAYTDAANSADYAMSADTCGDATALGGVPAADYRLDSETIDWSELTSSTLPTGLADGDDDTTYSAGSGLALTGTQFAADRGTIETWAREATFDTVTELRSSLDAVYMAKASCSANQILATDTNGAWTCKNTADLQLTESAVDQMVANNGYVAASALGSAAYAAATDFATAAQGVKADGALQRSGGTMTGAVTFPGGPGGWSASGTVGVGAAPSAAMVDIQGRSMVALSGTMGVLAGSAAVVGVGTSFTSQIAVGDTLLLGSQVMTVASIQSNTALTLTGNHTAGAATVTGYTDGDLLKVRNSAGQLAYSVDKSGIPHEPKRPWFVAGHNTNTWETAAAGWSVVPYNTVLGGNSGGWYNTTTNLFTAPVAGLYQCTSTHYMHSGVGTTPAYIHHNFTCNGDWHCAGEAATQGTYTITDHPSSALGSTHVDNLLVLTKGMTVGVSINLPSAGYYRYSGHSQFGCYLVAGD